MTGASSGRIVWSLEFWPEWLTNSVCPGESVCLQIGPPGHSICHPSLTFPPDKHASSLHCPWACSTPSLCGDLGFASLCAVTSALDLAFARLPSACSHGRPVCPGPASARRLPVGCLAPAPRWQQSEFASAGHLCQDLPSSTGCVCPQRLSLRLSLGTWRCSVSLEYLLSLLGLVSLPLSDLHGSVMVP